MRTNDVSNRSLSITKLLNTPIQLVWQGVFEKPADLEQANKVFRADEGLKQNIIKLSTYLSEL